jgi:hypothetical protein
LRQRRVPVRAPQEYAMIRRHVNTLIRLSSPARCGMGSFRADTDLPHRS